MIVLLAGHKSFVCEGQPSRVTQLGRAGGVARQGWLVRQLVTTLRDQAPSPNETAVARRNRRVTDHFVRWQRRWKRKLDFVIFGAQRPQNQSFAQSFGRHASGAHVQNEYGKLCHI